jgi:hypothetical protein
VLYNEEEKANYYLVPTAGAIQKIKIQADAVKLRSNISNEK